MYFAVRTIWTLKLTESLGESKNDSKAMKGRLTVAFVLEAAVNVPLGTSFVKKTPKKVASNSPRQVDFAIGLVNSVLNLPDWQVKHFE